MERKKPPVKKLLGLTRTRKAIKKKESKPAYFSRKDWKRRKARLRLQRDSRKANRR